MIFALDVLDPESLDCAYSVVVVTHDCFVKLDLYFLKKIQSVCIAMQSCSEV